MSVVSINMCKQKYRLKSYIMILFCAVIVVNCERWYSATIIPNEEPTDVQKKMQLWRTMQEQENYKQVSLNKKINHTNNKSKWYFQKNSDSPIYQQPSSTSSVDFSNNRVFPTTEMNTKYHYGNFTSFEYNKNIENFSAVKTSQSKRNFVRRCPSLQQRQKKRRNPNHTRKERFLEVFEVIEFDHVTCTSTSGLEGTCLHGYNCELAGGSAMGSCADGYGICCVVQYVCDGRSAAPGGWFTNPDFPAPSTERLSCTTTLDKVSADIKQIRLDFMNFEMLPPSAGTCEQDQFMVSGQNTNNIIPILCGINTGQHVYVEVGDVNGPLLLSVQTITAENRLYAIKITQLTRSNALAAPTGCLQYFKDANDYLESFNYRDKSEIVIPRSPSYLNNLNYAMCIERAPSSCSITYTNTGIMQIPNYDTDGLPIIPPRQAGVEIFNCPSDWLLISALRLCGERLNDGSVLQDFSLDAPVTDDGAGPIVVWFRSDGGYVGRGFKLYYLQNTCTTHS